MLRSVLNPVIVSLLLFPSFGSAQEDATTTVDESVTGETATTEEATDSTEATGATDGAAPEDEPVNNTDSAITGTMQDTAVVLDSRASEKDSYTNLGLGAFYGGTNTNRYESVTGIDGFANELSSPRAASFVLSGSVEGRGLWDLRSRHNVRLAVGFANQDFGDLPETRDYQSITGSVPMHVSWDVTYAPFDGILNQQGDVIGWYFGIGPAFAFNMQRYSVEFADWTHKSSMMVQNNGLGARAGVHLFGNQVDLNVGAFYFPSFLALLSLGTNDADGDTDQAPVQKPAEADSTWLEFENGLNSLQNLNFIGNFLEKKTDIRFTGGYVIDANLFVGFPPDLEGVLGFIDENYAGTTANFGLFFGLSYERYDFHMKEGRDWLAYTNAEPAFHRDHFIVYGGIAVTAAGTEPVAGDDGE